MESKTPQDQRPKYTSRFADPSFGAPRPSTATRISPASNQTQGERRPTGFNTTEAPKSRTAVKPAAKQSDEKPKREKPGHAKRTRIPGEKNRNHGKKTLLIALAALAVLFIVLVLVFSGRGSTHHQLPRIERVGSSIQAPEAEDT